MFRKILFAELTVFAGMASVLAGIYVVAILLMGEAWVERNALYLLTHGAYWILISLLICAMFMMVGGNAFVSPKVIKVIDEKILLLSKSNWIGHQTHVAIYSFDDDFERLIASGRVINIQSNGLIQIHVELLLENYSIDHLSKIKSTLIVRPGVVE